MNKKVYLQPQIKCAPLPMENLLSLSKPKTESLTDPDKPQTGPGYGGESGKEELNAKKHFDDLSSWDSWE